MRVLYRRYVAEQFLGLVSIELRIVRVAECAERVGATILILTGTWPCSRHRRRPGPPCSDDRLRSQESPPYPPSFSRRNRSIDQKRFGRYD